MLFYSLEFEKISQLSYSKFFKPKTIFLGRGTSCLYLHTIRSWSGGPVPPPPQSKGFLLTLKNLRLDKINSYFSHYVNLYSYIFFETQSIWTSMYLGKYFNTLVVKYRYFKQQFTNNLHPPIPIKFKVILLNLSESHFKNEIKFLAVQTRLHWMLEKQCKIRERKHAEKECSKYFAETREEYSRLKSVPTKLVLTLQPLKIGSCLLFRFLQEAEAKKCWQVSGNLNDGSGIE